MLRAIRSLPVSSYKMHLMYLISANLPNSENVRSGSLAADRSRCNPTVRCGHRSCSIPGHAQNDDAGNLSLRVEAEQETGGVAARERNLYFVECLVPGTAGV